MFTIHVPFLKEYDSGHYFTERNSSLAEWIHNYARTCTQANLAAHRSRFLFGSYLVKKVCINSICMLPTRFIAASQPINLSVLTHGVGFPCSHHDVGFSCQSSSVVLMVIFGNGSAYLHCKDGVVASIDCLAVTIVTQRLSM